MKSDTFIDMGDRVVSFEEIFEVFGTHNANDIPKLTARQNRERDTTPDVVSFFQNNQNMDRRTCR